MIETDADRLAMLTILGETVVVNGRTISAVFENEYTRVGVIYATSDPVLMCRAIDVSEVVRGAVVVARAVTYTVRDIQPDGTGITVLQLERS
jgi:hypothetical protein